MSNPGLIVGALLLAAALLTTGCLRSSITIIDNGDGSVTIHDTLLIRNSIIESRYGAPPPDGGEGFDEIAFASSGGANAADVTRGSIFTYRRFATDSAIIVERPHYLEAYNYNGKATTATITNATGTTLSTADLFGQGAMVDGSSSPLFTITRNADGTLQIVRNDASIQALVASLPSSLFVMDRERRPIWWKEMYVHIQVKRDQDSSTLLHFNGALLAAASTKQAHTPKDGIGDVVLPRTLNTGAIADALAAVSKALANDAGPRHNANVYTPEREARDVLESINNTLTEADYWRVYQEVQPRSELRNFTAESDPDADMGYIMQKDIIPEPLWMGSPFHDLERDLRTHDIPFTAVTHDSGRTLTVEQYTPWRATFYLHEDGKGALAAITKVNYHNEPSDHLMGIIKDQTHKRMGWIKVTDLETIQETNRALIYRYTDPLLQHRIESSVVYTETDDPEKPWRLTSRRRLLKD